MRGTPTPSESVSFRELFASETSLSKGTTTRAAANAHDSPPALKNNPELAETKPRRCFLAAHHQCRAR